MTFETLDYYVIKTLEKLEGWDYPELPIKESARNVFVGTGNAFNTGSIFTKKFGGSVVNTFNYQGYFSHGKVSDFDSVNIISASGGKDAIGMASFLKSLGFSPNLLTCDPNPPAAEYIERDNIFVYPSHTEPPTYNVSTYASMIHGIFRENPKDIIGTIKHLEIPDLKKYKFIFFISSDDYEPIAAMGTRKIGESLAGTGSHGESLSSARHGMLIHPNQDRLDFCINCDSGTENVYRLNSGSFLAAMMCVYYIVGKNQRPEDVNSTEKSYAANAKKLGWKFNKVW